MGKRAKIKPSVSLPQLDLFSCSTPTPSTSRAAPVEAPQPTSVAATRPARETSAPLDPVIEYLLASPRGPGRPNKPLREVVSAMDDRHRLLDVSEAAFRLGLSKSTLDKMRCSGRGPRFIRATDRAIRYDPADLDAFANERRCRSTSEAALAALRT